MKKQWFIQFINSRLLLITVVTLTVFSTGCIIVTDHEYGPRGANGRAFFGIDYDWQAPYSYWDNNPSVPNNPWFGEMYRTTPGVYDFEYFVNPWEYWYGTYQMWINPGQPGQPYGVAGAPGDDSYLLLICNPNGFYFEDWEECGCYRSGEEDVVIIERTEGEFNYRVEMRKTTIHERPTAQLPKYRAN
ncbi:MAG: hypothetical protein KDC12_14330 [Flavobacteriales bacterium]|nr:hypothetical protein [Flavobacteriales bacterium]